MGNQTGTNKTDPGVVAVYDKRNEAVHVNRNHFDNVAGYDRRNEAITVKQNPDDNDRPIANNGVEILTTADEEEEVSRSSTFVAETREGAATGSSGYASMRNEVSLTPKTGEILLRNFDASQRKGLKEEDKAILRRSFCFIKEEVDPDPLVDCFIRDGFLSEDDRERIKLAGTRKDQVDALLLKLVRMKPEAFVKFCEYLNDIGYGYVREHLLGLTEIDNIDQTQVEDLEHRIELFEPTLIEELESDAVAEVLLEHGEISFEEYSELRNQKHVGRMEKARQVIQLVLSNQPRSLDVFIHALKLTKGEYCIELLTNGRMTCAESNEVTETPGKVINMSTTRTPSKLLKNVERIELKLVFKNNVDSQEMVEELNCSEVKLAINATLFDKQLVLTKSKVGSVIIEIKVLRQDKRSGERDLSVDLIIYEILNVLSRHCQTFRKCVDQNIEVKFKTLCSVGRKIARTRVKHKPKITIERNLALLEEELDALTLMKNETIRDIFTEQEVTGILQSGQPRRKERTQRMFSTLLKKDSVSINTFYKILKIQKKELVTKCLQSNDDLTTNNNGIWTHENVTIMALHVSPLTLEKYCVDMGIINTDDFRVIRSRRTRNTLILQNLLAKDDDEIISFTRIMRWNQQIPRTIRLLKPEQQFHVEGKRRSKAKLVYIGEFKVVKEKEKPRPKAIATKKLHRNIMHRTIDFPKGFSSSESISESHEKKSPRGTYFYRNSLALDDDTYKRTKHEGRRTAESGISSSLMSEYQLSTVKREPSEQLSTTLSPFTSAKQYSDVKATKNVIAKSENMLRHLQTDSLRHIVVSPLSVEDLNSY